MNDDMETKEGAGGWEVPTKADSDGLVNKFRSNYVTFRSHSSGFDVFLDGNENMDVVDDAPRYGYEVQSADVTDGPHKVKITLGKKVHVRQMNDAHENAQRVRDE